MYIDTVSYNHGAKLCVCIYIYIYIYIVEKIHKKIYYNNFLLKYNMYLFIL